MSKITIKSGKGEITLRKSGRYVGLKSEKQKNLAQSKDIKKEFLKNLGGFNIVRLDKQGKTLDERLDEVRKKKDIDVGTHVYYVEGRSHKPLVPTGEIYIIFQEGTSSEEQNLVLDEYQLNLVERRDKNRIVAKVTAKSPNPCLLYTSPSPRDATLSRMPSSA